ncbi:MAG: DUF2835 domain-containing protein [Oleibacter sp.]|nr:DUF2835 domain-containing protein [Thalassolituus sp.]
MTKAITVSLNISASEYQRYYRGSVAHVLATTAEGLKVRFPANVLQKMVTHDGIRGRFTIMFDDNGRFLQIQRLD